MAKKGPKKKVKAKGRTAATRAIVYEEKERGQRQRPRGRRRRREEESDTACVRAKETKEGRQLRLRDGGQIGAREARADAETKSDHQSAEG